MTLTAVDIDEVNRIQTGDEARQLAMSTYQAFLDDLDRLEPTDWDAVTVCVPWTVSDVVRHVLGAAEANASMREMMRQQFHGARNKKGHRGNALDATNALQVRDRRHLDPSNLISELRDVAERSVAKRTARPAIFDRISLPTDPGGSTASGMPGRINLGELFRVIYTRDVWLHRIDIAEAVDRGLDMDPSTDGRIVEDVVKEWADRHGEPFDLTVTGSIGARYRRRGSGPTLEIDAVELCRTLSGREDVPPDRPGAELFAYRLWF